MQPSRLSATQVARITKALEVRASERGPGILGSQLGLIVNDAIRPDNLRMFGGLKALVDAELRHLVRLDGPDLQSNDLRLTIEAAHDARSSTEPVEDLREVAGTELWRRYSNPNVVQRLMAHADGRIIALPRDAAAPDGFVEIARPSAEDYRIQAKEFVGALEDQAAAATLASIVDEPDFYSRFIAQLRSMRSTSRSPLRDWETKRAEFVIERIRTELGRVGVASGVIDEVIQLAKPVPKAAMPKQALPAWAASSAFPGAHRAQQTERFRRFLLEAIAAMSESELRELRIPVGAAYEASIRTTP